jgi:hypothetical protein
MFAPPDGGQKMSFDATAQTGYLLDNIDISK